MGLNAVKNGAHDYLFIQNLDFDLVERSIRYSISQSKLKKELKHISQEQLLIKDKFISNVSHELRSPLASIYQFVTIMLDGLGGKITPKQQMVNQQAKD